MIDFKKNVELIENAIKEEHPELALEKMVLNLSESGRSKKEIYEFLFKFYLNEYENEPYLNVEKEHGDHPVELTMDRLWGWCHKDFILLPGERIK